MSKRIRGAVLMLLGIFFVILGFFGATDDAILLMILFLSGLMIAALGFGITLKESTLFSAKQRDL